ncbi:MAG: hydrolase, TatD family [Bacteroidetes bacterium]|nr:hydrolase, TatD family [Bacteroidota bacterium]
MIDTHSHIYSEEFDADRNEVIERARNAGVEHIVLPNIDSESLPRMLALESNYPGYCHAAIGLHPTSVKENYEQELNIVKSELERRAYVAIGEVGIDLYWDRTFYAEQVRAFQQQLAWALNYELPIIIHVRDAFGETLEALEPFRNKGLRGVFHSFTGTLDDARKIIDFTGFYLGINGIATFKNSALKDVLPNIELKHLLLETDSPYLAPSPYRGKRNESSYVEIVAEKLSDIYSVEKTEIVRQTNENSFSLFNFNYRTIKK